MAKKTRDYTNLKETERIRDAVLRNSTEVKDYSLKHIITTFWRINDYDDANHLNRLTIGDELFIGRTDAIKRGIHELVSRQDDNDWLPRDRVEVEAWQHATAPLIIDTTGVNSECLRDHVAKVTINKVSSIIDLEELLKATRYA